MRALSAFFLLSLLFLFSSSCDARKDPADYWKSIMKGEPMPEKIQRLVFHQDPSSLSKEKIKKWCSSSAIINMEHFRKDFDTSPNLIIYHSGAEPRN
ncbi:hypothetical protein Vadar_016618 [Vaccinium darrowii]|uniref:Uncharacterized protein n=1 Tax=Vaccinium darrowii TaxID=229202 RepID=A0ACB7X1H6_9ERIC|nr:hypothetical protein Vadar_016618 [Vaccinium darrowii]